MTAKKNQDTLRTQAGVTEAQACTMSGADLMRAAYIAKAGLTATLAAKLDGAALMKTTTPIDLGK